MKKIIKVVFITTIPVLTGYLVLGFGFDIILRANGYGMLLALAMSLFIYAGSMQYVAIGLLTSGASLITIALTTLMVNARHLYFVCTRRNQEMSDLHIWYAVAVIALLTALLRFLPFMVLGGNKTTPKIVEKLGRILPYAIMGMLVVYGLKEISFTSVSGFLPLLIACLVVGFFMSGREIPL